MARTGNAAEHSTYGSAVHQSEINIGSVTLSESQIVRCVPILCARNAHPLLLRRCSRAMLLRRCCAAAAAFYIFPFRAVAAAAKCAISTALLCVLYHLAGMLRASLPTHEGTQHDVRPSTRSVETGAHSLRLALHEQLLWGNGNNHCISNYVYSRSCLFQKALFVPQASSYRQGSCLTRPST